jgi:hypothetical protein
MGKALDALQRLVARFDQNRDAYLSGSYNETQLRKAKTPHEQESIKRHIAATDGQIDALVYELYGLKEEEIQIVEKTG